jgi:hypothetical protein
MAAAFALAPAPDWATLLNAAGREPGILPQLSGPLDAPPVGLGPVLDFDGTGFAPLAPGAPHLVLGGFPPQNLQAWVAAALLAGRLRALAAEGLPVDGRLAVFGRTEDRADPALTFAQRMVTRYFTAFPATGDDADRAPVLAAFHGWLDAFCAALPAFGPGVRADFQRMDWNLSGKPAAATRQSQILTAKGWNLARVQTDPARWPDLDPSFFASFLPDPMDEARFVPAPGPGGMACVP